MGHLTLNTHLDKSTCREKGVKECMCHRVCRRSFRIDPDHNPQSMPLGSAVRTRQLSVVSLQTFWLGFAVFG